MLLIQRFFKEVPSWVIALGVAIVEVLLVYCVSNLPFLIDVFLQDKDNLITVDPNNLENISFFREYYGYLHTKMVQGEALTYVCAFIAPVILWTTLDGKTKRTFKIVLCAIASLLCILSTAVYVEGRESVFVSGFGLYCAALATWIFCVLLRYFPPEPKWRGEEEINDISSHINSRC